MKYFATPLFICVFFLFACDKLESNTHTNTDVGDELTERIRSIHKYADKIPPYSQEEALSNLKSIGPVAIKQSIAWLEQTDSSANQATALEFLSNYGLGSVKAKSVAERISMLPSDNTNGLSKTMAKDLLNEFEKYEYCGFPNLPQNVAIYLLRAPQNKREIKKTSQYNPQNDLLNLSITLKDTNSPIVLFLVSNYGVNWQINEEKKGSLIGIYMSGSGRQLTKGVEDYVKVKSATILNAKQSFSHKAYKCPSLNSSTNVKSEYVILSMTGYPHYTEKVLERNISAISLP